MSTKSAKRNVDNFSLRPGYQARSVPVPYHDSLEDSRIYQVPVYKHAATLVAQMKLLSVLDLGCGLGSKLIDYVAPFCSDITGVDMERSILECRRMHKQGTWIIGDLENPEFQLGRTFDLIISADVVEHLINPDSLLTLARNSSHKATRFIISTPERDLRRGKHDMGPPHNPAHVREWNASEFEAYLKSRGLNIHDSQIVDLRAGMATCQMVTTTYDS